MRINTSLKVLSAAVGLACSGGVFAATTGAGATGTIFVNVVDQNNGASLMFDTGLLVSSFTDPTTQSFNLATLAASSPAWSSFVGAEGAHDTIDFSVVGNYSPTSGTPYALTLATATTLPTTKSGVIGAEAAGQIQAFVGTINNTAGGATYNAPGTSATLTWNGGGYEAGLTNNLGTSDNTLLDSSIGFYAVTTSSSSGSRSGASAVALTGSWELTSAGLLTYTEPGGTSVPLPTPLILMLSGLGLFGLVGRRNRADAAV